MQQYRERSLSMASQNTPAARKWQLWTSHYISEHTKWQLQAALVHETGAQRSVTLGQTVLNSSFREEEEEACLIDCAVAPPAFLLANE